MEKKYQQPDPNCVFPCLKPKAALTLKTQYFLIYNSQKPWNGKSMAVSYNPRTQYNASNNKIKLNKENPETKTT